MFLIGDRSTQFWVSGVFAIVLLSSVLFFQNVLQTSIDHPIRGDAQDYVAYAFNLKTHGVYSRRAPDTALELLKPDALRAPGYPFVLSFFVDSEHQTFAIANVLFMQAVVGILTVMTYLSLFRRLMPTGWALTAGLLTAISPHLLNSSVYILSESLFTFILGLHLLVLERAIQLKQLHWAFIAGLLLAIDFLVRPITQYLFFLYLTIAIANFSNFAREYRKNLIYFLLPVLMAIGMWSVRNLIETGRSSDPTLAANFLQHGMYINMMYEDHPESYGYPYRYDPISREIEGDTGKILEEMGRKFLQNPRRYVAWFLIGKPIQFFSWNLTESVGDAFIYAPIYSPYFDKTIFSVTHAIAKALHPFLMFLGVIGAFCAFFQAKKNVTAVLLGIVIFYFTALHMIGAPFPRYSIPLRPISYGLAVFALSLMTQKLYALLSKQDKDQ